MPETILVVEDEPILAEVLQDYMRAANYQCHIIDNGLQVEPWVKQHKPDLMLLDLMLPGIDGLQVCRSIRQFSQLPIIMVTAKTAEVDRLLGLDIGADDYICKPYSPKEVVARVKAVLRRQHASTNVTHEYFTLDEHRNSLFINGVERTLTTVECNLLKFLISQHGKILSRNQLMENMYTDNRIVSNRTIDSHIKKLRQKIASLLPKQEVIYSIYGAGYRFEWPM